MARILIVDAEPERLKVLRLCLGGTSHMITCSSSEREALTFLANVNIRYDLLILGEVVEGIGLKNLMALVAQAPRKPALIRLLSGKAAQDLSQQLELTRGFNDRLVSPLNITEVQSTVERALEENHASDPATVVRFAEMVGSGERMQEIFRLILKAANNDGPVLLEGEFGVGKNVAAIQIHRHSRRHHREFGTVQCNAINSDDLESQLFGCEKGAWAWVTRPTDGRLLQLHGGTIHLQGIETVDTQIQAKLIDLSQNQTFTRFRGEQQLRADVRLITSAARPLSEGLNKGGFLPKLYYHLTANRIEIPPLRNRPMDIPEVAKFFLDNRGIQIAGDALELLMNYSWPGNLAQLKSIVTGAADRCDDNRIEINDLPSELVHAVEKSGRKHRYLPPAAT